jgi:NitT/TauT family transport system permease protein
MVFRVPEYLLPAPSAIAGALATEWRTLAFHTWITLYEILCGFALSVVVGVPLAMLIVGSPAFERSVYPCSSPRSRSRRSPSRRC